MKIIPFSDVRALWHPVRQEFIRPGYVYIGVENKRFNVPRSEWFTMEVISRQPVADYRKWLIAKPDLDARLQELRGKTLVCSCVDEYCHGHELIKMVSASGNGTQGSLWSLDQMLAMEFAHLTPGTKKKVKKKKALQWESPWIAQGGIYIHVGYGLWEILLRDHAKTKYWREYYTGSPAKFETDTNRLTHYLAVDKR